MSTETEYVKVYEKPIEEVPVPNYSDEEHGTWELLIKTQQSLVKNRACEPFIKGLERVNFPENHIPKLRDISANIEKHSGWKLLRVDGLVHPTDFFDLLSRQIFPSTDFIRKRSELLYTPAPDMFHDLFGHSPLLTDPDFCEFFKDFGTIGVNASKRFPQDHFVHQALPRLYWFNVEFGLINDPKGLRAYGAGSVSSPEEIKFCVSEKSRKHPFDVEVISKRDYDIWHLQEDVFVIDSFQQLGKEFRAWARRSDLLD